MTTTFLLRDTTYLKKDIARAWVAGWINGGGDIQVLQKDGSFGGTNPASVPFHAVATLPTVTLSVPTNGNDRMVFVVSKDQPAPLTISNSEPIQYTAYPYANPPGVAAPGPYDIFEFGLNAQDDLSAVNGFGLNLWFTVAIGGFVKQQFGARGDVTRKAIGAAFKKFIKREATSLPSAAAFAELFYDSPIAPNAPTPPQVDDQFFAICDPNDMLASLTGNYTGTTGDPLSTYWDETLTTFFAVNNALSINLSSNPPAPNIYSGVSSLQTNPLTGVASPAYTLSNGSNTYTFYMPLAAGDTLPGLTGAQYVFQQAFGNLTPAGSAGDAGLLQDTLWQALCRGVANAGVSTQPISNGESTSQWNDWTTWYPTGVANHLYAKFLHCSDIDGNDSRVSGKKPIFHGGAAYGFSEDENPLGPYSGPNVPSKTVANVPDGATVTIYVGPWDVIAA